MSITGERSVGNLINFSCKCGNEWWGGMRNDECRRCKKTGKHIPFEKRVGLGYFRCDCGRTFVGKAGGDVRSKCHGCDKLNLPYAIEPMGEVKKKSTLTHNCELCKGRGECPVANGRRKF
jgi:hypothetical protein